MVNKRGSPHVILDRSDHKIYLITRIWTEARTIEYETENIFWW